MPVSPRAPVVEPDAVAHQHLRQPVTCAHQIQPQRLARANKITQRFLLGARDTDRVQLAGQQQPDEMLGVTPIGLDLVSGRARDLRRRSDHALHAPPRELARECVPGRSGLVRDPDRARQTGAEPGGRQHVARHRKRLQLAALSVQHRRDDLRRVHVQTDKGSSLRHGWFLLFDCGPPRGVEPRGITSPPHDGWGNRPLLPLRPDGPTIHMVYGRAALLCVALTYAWWPPAARRRLVGRCSRSLRRLCPRGICPPCRVHRRRRVLRLVRS